MEITLYSVNDITISVNLTETETLITAPVSLLYFKIILKIKQLESKQNCVSLVTTEEFKLD